MPFAIKRIPIRPRRSEQTHPMRRYLKITAVLLAILLSLPLLGVAWLAFAPAQDPERFVRSELPAVVAQRTEEFTGEGCASGRRCRDVVLTVARERPIRFAVSLPERLEGEELPVVVVFGGLKQGRESLRYVPDLGRTAVVTYEYPIVRDSFDDAWLGRRFSLAHDIGLIGPKQITILIQWIQDQGWADRRRISLVGASLGAMAIPTVYRMAAHNGVWFGPMVMLYGGARLDHLTHQNLRLEPQWLRRAVAWLAGLAARPFEPAAHLPYLRGEVLVVNGEGDEKMPPESVQALHELTPDPKDVIMIEGDEHLDPENDPEFLGEVLAVARDWLAARNALGI